MNDNAFATILFSTCILLLVTLIYFIVGIRELGHTESRIIDTICARDADPAACVRAWEESK